VPLFSLEGLEGQPDIRGIFIRVAAVLDNFERKDWIFAIVFIFAFCGLGGFKVFRVFKVFKDFKDFKDFRDFKVFKVFRVFWDLPWF
jgi:hypothetical protein